MTEKAIRRGERRGGPVREVQRRQLDKDVEQDKREEERRKNDRRSGAERRTVQSPDSD